MSKNIVIFSDGTGQDGGQGPNTNIYKIFNVVEDRTIKQIAFYDPGVGSKNIEILGKAIGFGISKNIKQCYKFIFENYEAGDDIYLFGFSRGAATVRSLSGFIELIGILPKSRPELIDEAYDIYKSKGSADRAKDFLARHHTMWTKVKFIGVFDTVAALKGKSDFHNFKLSAGVENARAAISLDERRVPFMPILWEKEISADQSLAQVNFLGVHTDVGGGYEESGLSDISYEWMLKEAKEIGLLIYKEERLVFNPNPDGVMHEEKYMIKKLFFKKKYEVRDRSWDSEKFGDFVIHPSVLKRSKDKENGDGKYDCWGLREEKRVVLGE